MTEDSDLFDDIPGQLAALEARVEEMEAEQERATGARKTEIGWWLFGALKHRDRLGRALRAQERGEHRFVIHEMEGDRIYCVCSCGAKFPGSMHEDFTLEEFPTLEGHHQDLVNGPVAPGSSE